MQFGLDQLPTSLRPGSSYLDSRHVEIARSCSNLVADRLEAKFHYAILVADLVADMVADLQRAGSWPTTPYLAREQRASRSATSLEPVCDQDSVRDFGFNITVSKTDDAETVP